MQNNKSGKYGLPGYYRIIPLVNQSTNNLAWYTMNIWHYYAEIEKHVFKIFQKPWPHRELKDCLLCTGNCCCWEQMTLWGASISTGDVLKGLKHNILGVIIKLSYRQITLCTRVIVTITSILSCAHESLTCK